MQEQNTNTLAHELTGLLLDSRGMLAAHDRFHGFLSSLLKLGHHELVAVAVATIGNYSRESLLRDCDHLSARTHSWLSERSKAVGYEYEIQERVFHEGTAKLAQEWVAARLPPLAKEIQRLRRAGDDEAARAMTEEREGLRRFFYNVAGASSRT